MNGCGLYYIVGGIPLPAVLELTLLRRDRALLELSDETFPTQIDMPNNPHFADLALGTFRF